RGVSRAALLASSITVRKSAERKQRTYRPTSLRGECFGSPVEFASNHVDRPEGWNHVGDHVAGQNFVQSRHDRKARWTDAHAVRIRGSIAHNVEPELPVGAFNRKVDLALRPPHAVAVHDQLELLHEPFD